MRKELKLIFLVAKEVRRAALKERMMYGFLLLALLFILMANVPFMVDDPRIFEGQTSLVSATQIGFVSINIFTLLISVFVSVATIQSFLSRERLIMLLSKPIRRWQVLEGVLLGLFEMIFLNWCLMTMGIWLIMISQTGLPLTHIPIGLSVTLLLGLLVISLTIFCFTLIPNILAGVLTFLLVIAGFGAPLAQEAFARVDAAAFFDRVIQGTFKILPSVNGLAGLSMKMLGLFDIKIHSGAILLHVLISIVFLNVFSCWKFSRLSHI